MSSVWVRLRLRRFGWVSVGVAFSFGIFTTLLATKGPHFFHARVSAQHRLPSRLEYALSWLAVLPLIPQERSGTLTERDFPIAAGLLPQILVYFKNQETLATQVAILAAVEGSDREQQAYSTRSFHELASQPAQTISAVNRAFQTLPVGAWRERVQLVRLLLALPGRGEVNVELKRIYRSLLAHAVSADEPGAEIPLLALYGLLDLEPSWIQQKDAVRDALAAQAGDPRMQMALRRTVFLRSQELVK
ncbi:hypothetical protein WDW37_19120 [Bdellovibrionota bacterium FG-1]